MLKQSAKTLYCSLPPRRKKNYPQPKKNKKKSKTKKRVFQLRVIRAFRSTLEDMEEKRSVHSMRSTRSYMARPMSDISYVDEDTLSPTSGGGPAAERRQRQNNSCKGMKYSSGTSVVASHDGQHPAGSAVVSTSTHTNNSNNQHQYLKVEGTSYRVHRGGSGGGGSGDKNNKRELLHSRQHSAQSADAQTQSAESSFAVDDAPGPPLPCVQIVSSSPSPQPVSVQATPPPQQQVVMPPRVASPGPSLLIANPCPSPGAQMAAGPAAGPAPGTAVTVQHAGGALQTHILPSPIYGFGYDPSYCQYLGQGVDGYQYELVRRPSIGPPVELLVPQAPGVDTLGGMQRRASGHGIPYLTPNSMQGSFDSAAGPPPSSTPIFIQQQQPLSPRHLHHNPQQMAPQAPHSPIHRPSSDSAWGVTTTTSNSGPPGPPNTNNDIPKLIHETSI